MDDRCDSVVLFGATGSLAKYSLFPALYELALSQRLPSTVVGVAVSDWSDGQLREYARQSVREAGTDEPDEAAFERLAAALTFVQGDYRDQGTYDKLRTAVHGSRPLLYLAVPPTLIETIVEGVSQESLHEYGRVVVEKPFGTDLESARELNRVLLRRFAEDDIFRIDHFLGKEQVLDLLVLRFGNTILEPALNRQHVAGIRITMAEESGIAGRGSFYDETGALRDVVQNHLLQLLTMIAMEPPVALDTQSLRDEKAKVLRAMPALDPDAVVLGQYTGYRDEDGVDADSDTETFMALRTEIDSWRWAGVPVHIQAGKNLATTETEIRVEFNRPPRLLFTAPDSAPPAPNSLVFRTKPGERMSLTVQLKEPGEELVSAPIELSHTYDEHEQSAGEPPYVRLLEDAIAGDQRLFARSDAVEQAWRIVDPVLRAGQSPYPYEPGSQGPSQADSLF